MSDSDTERPDPNEMLAAMRQAITDWEAAESRSLAENDAAERIGGAAGALDHWLTRGGALPRDWNGADNRDASPEPGTSILKERFGSHTVLIHKDGEGS